MDSERTSPASSLVKGSAKVTVYVPYKGKIHYMDTQHISQNSRRSNGDRALCSRPLTTDGAVGGRIRCKRGGKRRRRHRAGGRRQETKSQRLGKNNVRVCFWNCRSVRQRGDTLQRLAYDTDVLVLQETRLAEEDGTLNMSGFQVTLNNINHGQAILVRQELKAIELDLKRYESERVQLQGISLEIKKKMVNIVNVYACNNALTTTETWEFLGGIMEDIKGEVVFCGDFNARGQLWGNDISNLQGEKLGDWLLGSALTCINNGQITRMAQRSGDSDSVIDLAIVSAGLVGDSRFCVLQHHGSDHLPCSILLNKKSTVATGRPRAVFQYPSSTTTNTSVIERLRQRKRGKGRKVLLRQPPWWNDTLEEAWLKKRAVVKHWQKMRTRGHVDNETIEVAADEMKKAVQAFKELAKTSKQERWEKFCHEVNADTGLTQFWNLHRGMQRKNRKELSKPILTAEGNILVTDEERGRAFLERYLKQTDQKNLEERRRIKEELGKLVEAGPPMNECKFTVDGIRTVTKEAKITAPGPDGVTYDKIGELNDSDIQEIADLFNRSMSTGDIPSDWLDSYLAVVPKPGRDHSRLGGYRIITMQNTISKLMEKQVARTLAWQLETMNVLPPGLGSYRRGRDTWANAAVFAYDTYEGFQEKEETIAVAIDLEDAYNRVSFEVLIGLLLDFNIHPTLTRWIAGALMERTVALRHGTWSSRGIRITPGLPQGSPLSPVLYNVYTVHLASLEVPTGRVLTFADDVLAYARGRDRDALLHGMQNTLTRINEWCEESQAVINPAKATTLWCSLNNHIMKKDLPLVQIGGKEIPRVSEMTYLGISMDRTLSFKRHVDNVVTKCSKGLAAVKLMAGMGIQQKTLFILFKALVLSVIDYGLGLLTLSKSQLERLERTQNEGMRTVLGCTRDTSAAGMRFMLGLPSIAERHREAQVKGLFRVTRQRDHLLHKHVGTTKGSRLRRGKSWLAEAETTVHTVCDPRNIKVGQEWISSKESAQYMKVVIKMGRRNEEQNVAETSMEVLSCIDENTQASDVVIFTDGSVKRGVQSGWGFSARCRSKIIMEQSGAYFTTTSSMRMEEQAATKALEWISGTIHTGAAIVTDSQSMLRKIERGMFKPEWLACIERSRLEHLAWIFTPGHAGVAGNERADKLAGSATVQAGTNLQMEEKDVLLALKQKRGREEGSTVDRLSTLGVREGDAAASTLSGRWRRINNQILTGTVSRCTLAHVLARGTEQIWSCPDCRDVNSATK